MNRSALKRVLKAASPLSVFAHDDSMRFSLGNDPHCSCDLHVDGPDGMGRISIAPAASESLVKVAQATIAAGFTPLEFRVFWGDAETSASVEMGLEEFRALAAESSYDSSVAYVVSA